MCPLAVAASLWVTCLVWYGQCSMVAPCHVTSTSMSSSLFWRGCHQLHPLSPVADAGVARRVPLVCRAAASVGCQSVPSW